MRGKDKKTKLELETLLRERTKGMPVERLKVRRDPIMGWSVAFVVRERPVATDCLAQFMEIERDFRRKFEIAP
jgi:hypothetical protein